MFLEVKACLKKIKKAVFCFQKSLKDRLKDRDFLLQRLLGHAVPMSLEFDFDKLKELTLGFVSQMYLGPSVYSYRYSTSCQRGNLYSSAYAVMILAMYGELDKLSCDQKKEWVEYFDSHQSSHDGLFYDKGLLNELYNDTDWWGARHLVLHMVTVYTVLGAKPRHSFHFLVKFYDLSYLKEWLESLDWKGKFACTTDADNKIMNIGVLLQYQRDYWNDEAAGKSVRFMQEYLKEKINPDTGMWGYYDLKDKNELSRMVQCAYHLFSVFFFDNIELNHKEKIIDHVLRTQNIYGGFGVRLNSSACEDIDSIDILIRMMKWTDYRKSEVRTALKKAFVWVLANQNEDGGFVFFRNEPFVYGHQEMSSQADESSMFATWFRTLTIAYLTNYLFGHKFQLPDCPGLEN